MSEDSATLRGFSGIHLLLLLLDSKGGPGRAHSLACPACVKDKQSVREYLTMNFCLHEERIQAFVSRRLESQPILPRENKISQN